MKPKHPIILIACIIFAAIQNPAPSATINEQLTVIKTYPFSDPDPLPIMIRSSMWGNGSKLYPYYSFSKYTDQPIDKSWNVVHLENPYIDVFVLPQVGGKVWGAVEKSTNNQFIYLNQVLKFRNIALRGPWTSGGIEFNFGIVGHTPAGATPVDYLLRKNSDGSVSCIVGNMDLPSRTRWSVDITLQDDKAYFQTTSLFYNPSPLNQSYYVWLNSADKVSNDLEFIFPGNFSIGHSYTEKPDTWPVDRQGHDVSWYKNNNFGGSKSYFIFGKYENFYGGYWHDSDFGFGHWALYDDAPGKKFWLWALSRQGGIWQDLLTDTDGQYSEPQTGRLYNQSDHEFFTPYTADTWTELWFPYKQIGPMTKATPSAVLNVTHTDNSLNIGICPLQPLDDNLTITLNGGNIYTEHLKLKPMQIYQKQLPPKNTDALLEVKLSNKLYYTSDQKANDLTCPFSFRDHNQSTFEELFLSAQQSEKSRDYAKALEQYLSCLEQQPNHTQSLTRVAELYYRKAQYEKALTYARKALENVMYDPDAKYIYGVISRKLGNLNDAKEAFGWAARSMKYRSNAYCQLAEINMSQNNLDLTIEYSQRSLDYNKYNINAYQTRAIAFRLQNQPEKAKQTIQQLLDFDPLNHLARFELYLLEPNQKNLNNFQSMIRNELPCETYIEMALYYHSMGLDDPAVKMLELSPEYPTAYYWLAWLLKDTSPQESDKYLQKANAMSPELVFPFRQETITPMRWAIEKAPDNWKPKYYLGLIHMGLGNIELTRQLFEQCSPADFATFYLARGYLYKSDNPQKTLADFQTALKMDRDDWRTWYHLILLYNSLEMFDKSLDLASQAAELFPSDEALQIELARALINNKQYDKALAILQSGHTLPHEGASNNHQLFVKCNIHLAVEQLEKNNFAAAISYLEQSKQYPEGLGSGKPYDPDYATQDRLIAICRQAKNKPQEPFQITPEIKQLIQEIDTKFK